MLSVNLLIILNNMIFTSEVRFSVFGSQLPMHRTTRMIEEFKHVTLAPATLTSAGQQMLRRDFCTLGYHPQQLFFGCTLLPPPVSRLSYPPYKLFLFVR